MIVFKSINVSSSIIFSILIVSFCFILTFIIPIKWAHLEMGLSSQKYQIFFYDNGYKASNSSIYDSGNAFFQENVFFKNGLSFQLGNYNRFRLDINGNQVAELKEIVIVQKYLFFNTYNHFKEFSFVGTHDVKLLGYKLIPDGNDPYVDIVLNDSDVDDLIVSWDFLFLFLLVYLVVESLIGFKKIIENKNEIVLLAFLSVLSVIFSIVIQAKLNHGPDEAMHFGSFFWYFENIFPPSIKNGESIYLHQLWNNSYIFGSNGDLSYLLTARFADFIFYFANDYLLSLRITQLFLVLIGAGLSSKLFNKTVSVSYMLSFIIVPQLAYLVSYLNGDLLSFVFAFIGFALINEEKNKIGLQVVIGLFLILNSKLNYQLVLVILFLKYFLERKYLIDFKLNDLLVYISIVPFLLYRRIFNYYDQYAVGETYIGYSSNRVNQMNVDDKVAHVKNAYARYLNGIDYFNWNVPFQLEWYISSFKSFFGVFGWMNMPIPTVNLYISVMIFLYIVLNGLNGYKDNILMFISFVIFISASLYFSISYDYQPQGRYVFPLLVVVFMLAKNKIVNHANLLSFAGLNTIFVLSSY